MKIGRQNRIHKNSLAFLILLLITSLSPMVRAGEMVWMTASKLSRVPAPPLDADFIWIQIYPGDSITNNIPEGACKTGGGDFEFRVSVNESNFKSTYAAILSAFGLRSKFELHAEINDVPQKNCTMSYFVLLKDK